MQTVKLRLRMVAAGASLKTSRFTIPKPELHKSVMQSTIKLRTKIF